MKFNRIILDKDTSYKLSVLKGRTGLTPNILCRFALMLSLKEKSNSEIKELDNEGQELSKHILFGEIEHLFNSLLLNSNSSQVNKTNTIKMLISNGVITLFNRIKVFSDIRELI